MRARPSPSARLHVSQRASPKPTRRRDVSTGGVGSFVALVNRLLLQVSSSPSSIADSVLLTRSVVFALLVSCATAAAVPESRCSSGTLFPAGSSYEDALTGPQTRQGQDDGKVRLNGVSSSPDSSFLHRTSEVDLEATVQEACRQCGERGVLICETCPVPNWKLTPWRPLRHFTRAAAAAPQSHWLHVTYNNNATVKRHLVRHGCTSDCLCDTDRPVTPILSGQRPRIPRGAPLAAKQLCAQLLAMSTNTVQRPAIRRPNPSGPEPEAPNDRISGASRQRLRQFGGMLV